MESVSKLPISEETAERTMTAVHDDESPFTAMQRIDHRSDMDLGLAVKDSLNGEEMYLRYVDDGVWLVFKPALDDVLAFQPDECRQYLNVHDDSDMVVYPAKFMPFFGGQTTIKFDAVADHISGES